MRRSSKLRSFVGGVALLAMAVIIFGAGLLTLWVARIKVPDFNSFTNLKVIQSTKIYDRTGKILLWDIHQNIRRTVVPFSEISRNLKNATVAIEDSNFYNHDGIDLKAIVRAFISNIENGNSRQGGSTISQQLIKNTFLTREKSYTRKIKEAILTLKLEKQLPKEKILGLYLNQIPYGGVNYGIEAASQSFFGKHASELTLAESAYLAALPQSPTYYSPYGNHRDKLKKREDLVLKRMEELGFITEPEEKKAQKEKVKFLNRGNSSIKAPHFSIYIRSYLEKKYGKDVVENGGLKVITTLNYNLQQKAEEMVKKYVEGNVKKFGAYNAGLVGIDPKTGQILVMVGSKDWSGKPLPEGCSPGINCKFEPKPNITSYGMGRQPGSSIKPFVYATAFEKGYTPETVLFNLRTEFNSSCGPDYKPKPGTDVKEKECYHPRNYNHVFSGPMTLRNALSQSVNVPSVKVLYLAGLKDSLKTIRDMGITTLNDPGRYGLTLVLGGGEVSLLEMTSGYGVFANEGLRNNTTGILKVEDSQGNILEEFKPSPRQVIGKNIALLVSNVLSDNKARTPAFGPRSWLYFPNREVAVKTGTTNNYKDAWVIGYTPNFSLGVWTGNNDNSPMEKKVAGFIAAPLWNAFLKDVFKNLPNENFEKPQPQLADKPVLRGDWRGGETYKIDKISGKLATEFTPPELIEEKTLTQVHNILFWVNKKDPLGPRPLNPENDSQFELWEKPVRDWAAKNGIKDETMEDVPKEFDNIHRPEYAPKISVISPTPNSLHKRGEKINIKISYESKFGMDQVDFFFGNKYLGSSKNSPFGFSFIIPLKTFEEGSIEPGNVKTDSYVKIIAYDNVRNKTEIVVPVRISD